MQGHRGFALLPLAPAAALVMALAGAGPAHATGTTITVTGFGDDPSATCADATHCASLRAAVAQADGASGDTIALPAGTYVLSNENDASPSLHVTSSMTISGAGASTTTVEGACNAETTWMGRLFTVNPDGAADVAINGLTLSHGLVPDDTDFNEDVDDGGAVLVEGGAAVTMNGDVVTGNEAIGNGGGIALDTATGSLSTTDTIVKDNVAGTQASPCAPASVARTAVLDAGSVGGGIYSNSQLTMTSSSVSGNTAGGSGGGLYVNPDNGVTDTLDLAFIHDNLAMGSGEVIDNGGGGVYAELIPGARLDVNQSTLSNNHAGSAGGGAIYADQSLPDVAARTAVTTPDVTVDDTTLDGNTAAVLGGGVYLRGGLTVSATNDTVYGNSAGAGGGIALGEAVGAQLALESVTIDGNNADGNLGGGLFLVDGTGTIHNSVVALNESTPTPPVSSVLRNCTLNVEVPSLTSLGYNVSDDTTCHLTATGDQQPPNSVPALGPLQDNGGPTDGAPGDTSPTLTQSPTTGSTTLNSGDPNSFPPTDERGVSRPQQAPSNLLGRAAPKAAGVAARTATGLKPDIGALEVKAAVVSTPTPTPTATATPTTRVQAIHVPETGGDPGSGMPAAAILIGVSLLTAAAGLAAARRRR